MGLEIHTPSKEVRVNQEQHDNHAHENLYVAIRDAFNAAERQLKRSTRNTGSRETMSSRNWKSQVFSRCSEVNHGRSQTLGNRSRHISSVVSHLDAHKDVQNIDLMNLASFCRNCLSKWYRAEAEERGIELDYESARKWCTACPTRCGRKSIRLRRPRRNWISSKAVLLIELPVRLDRGSERCNPISES